MAKKQRVRSSTEIDAIFDKAGLHVCYSSEETVVHKNFCPMKIWLLSKNAAARATVPDSAPESQHDEGREEGGDSQVVEEQDTNDVDGWDICTQQE